MPISLTGSLNISGSNTLIGTKTITGSVFISGSKTVIGTNTITGSMLISGSLTAVGTITATTLVVQTITSSISSITGSTNFGSLSSNTHTFTGSINASGSGNFLGSITATDLIVSDTYANDPLIKLVTTTSGNVEVQLRTATTTYNAGIGVVTSGYDFSLFTNNTTRMFISSSGNVGIGTSNPNIGGYGANGRLLTIQGVSGSYGVLELTSNSANADGSAIGRLDFGSDGQAANYKAISSIASFLTGSTSTKFGADLRFYTRVDNAGTGDPVERMRITSAGNVGIGTSTPTRQLFVNSTAFFDNNGDGSTTNPSIAIGSTSVGISYLAGGNLALLTGALERMRITSGGLVGIGTSSPNASYKLTLSGASSGVVAGLALVDTEAYSYSMYTGASTLIFRDITNAAERMRISSAGDVYIGSSTTDKSSRLVAYGTTTDGTTYAFRCYSYGSDILFGVRTDGYINTGTFTNSPYNLVRTGRVMMVDSGGGVGYQSSTRESKININNLTDISFLYQLNPVSFNYRKTEEISNTFTDEYNEDLHYGLIADEVEIVNKELVFYNEKNGQKEVAGVEYGKLTAVLIKAIQELTARVQYLENK